MKQINFPLLILGILLVGCGETNKNTTAVNEEDTLAIKENASNNKQDDEQQLQQLVRRLYEWNETKSSKKDFDVLADTSDSLYVGLDLKQHTARLAELKEIAIFSDEFIDNYNKIALSIDKGLKKKEITYFVGELPPYGGESDPWCNCQDSPANYWKKISLHQIKIVNSRANFYWSWGDDFMYKVEATKLGGQWRITYLEGFDFKRFMGV